VLVDLVRHTEEQPWSRVNLIFPGLVWIAARRDTAKRGPASWGWGLVAGGIFLELLAIGGDVVRFGRIGLAAAAIGLCFAAGWTSIRVALLFVWSIPLPAALLNRVSPGLEMSTMGFGADVASMFGFAVVRATDTLASAGRVLEILPSDGGLQTAFVLAGFGAFQGIWQAEPVSRILMRAGIGALSALPLQLALGCTAALALGLGAPPSTIRAWLSVFSWLGVSAVGLSGVVVRAFRSRDRRLVRT
jgi:hypothetical protein